MRLVFEVGVDERHQVSFFFDKFWGHLSIKVDGRAIHRGLRFASINLVKRWEFTVGDDEKHDVIIEKERQQFLAGFRPQTVRAYVDGQLVAEQTG